MRTIGRNWPILHRYIFGEILSPTFVSLFVFTGVLFLINSLKLFKLVVNKNVSAGDMLMLFACIVPRFLEVALPMSVLIGTLIAFSRLSAASELVVMKATGVSLRQLAYPVILFGMLASLFAATVCFWLRPWAGHRFAVGTFEIAKRQASTGLVPGIFNELGQLTVYAESVDEQSGLLKSVIIADRRSPETTRNFFARHGNIVSDDIERTLSVRLFDGSIHEGAGLNYNVTYFDVNNINIDQQELFDESAERGGKRISEMPLGEALRELSSFSARPQPMGRKDLQKLASMRSEIHRRFALPVVCLIVAIIAMALGMQPARGGRSWGAMANIFAGIVIILLYYLGFAFADALGRLAIAPAGLLMWFPNIVFGTLALLSLIYMESPEWLTFRENTARFLNATAQKAQRLLPRPRIQPEEEL